MTIQVALIVFGAAVGGAVAVLMWRLAPARPDVRAITAELHAGTTTSVQVVPERSTRSDRLGAWATRNLPAWLWHRDPADDLFLLQIPAYIHHGKKTTQALLGLMLPLVMGYLATVVGISMPWIIFVVAALGLAAYGFIDPDLQVRSQASARRVEYTRALAVYTGLVANERLARASAPLALNSAAHVLDSEFFTRIRATLSLARWNNQDPAQALEELSIKLNLPELGEVARIVDMANRGSQIRDMLTSKARSIRSSLQLEDLRQANAATETLTIPLGGVLLTYVAIIMIPTVLTMLLG